MIIRCLASACSSCCQCCYSDTSGFERHYTYDSYPYYNNNSIWMTYWFCYPIPTPVFHHHHHHNSDCCNPSLCFGCSSCDCNGGDSGHHSILLIIILVLALIGLIFSILVLVILFTKYYHKHKEIVRKYNDALKKRVKDLSLEFPLSGANENLSLDELI